MCHSLRHHASFNTFAAPAPGTPSPRQPSKLRGVLEDQHILDGNPLSARSLRQVLALLERELRWTTARPVP